MSERHTPHHESHERLHEHHEHHEVPQKSSEHHRQPEHQQAEVEALQRSVEQHAISKEQYHGLEEEHTPAHHGTISRDIKSVTYKRTVQRLQKRLHGPDRLASKIIHNPVIEKISEPLSKTVARPSGILGGGISAFVSTLALLYITRTYGYEFNYLVFIMMFVFGFALGSLIELTYKLFVIKKSRR